MNISWMSLGVALCYKIISDCHVSSTCDFTRAVAAAVICHLSGHFSTSPVISRDRQIERIRSDKQQGPFAMGKMLRNGRP